MNEIINSLEKTELHCGESERDELHDLIEISKSYLYSNTQEGLNKLCSRINIKLLFYIKHINNISEVNDVEIKIYKYINIYDRGNYTECLTLFLEISDIILNEIN
tara:strand:+ start:564 stop:878 length:315 start_codon:yes stop_codon:yes gene_type:complete